MADSSFSVFLCGRRQRLLCGRGGGGCVSGTKDGVDHVAAHDGDGGVVQLGQLVGIVGLQQRLQLKSLGGQVVLHEALHGLGVLGRVTNEYAYLVDVHVGILGHNDAILGHLGQIVGIILAPRGGGDVGVADLAPAVPCGECGGDVVGELGGGEVVPIFSAVTGDQGESYGKSQKQGQENAGVFHDGVLS